MRSAARRVARTALLAALALALGSLETMLPPLPFFPPGAKPGLANIVVMYALLREGAGAALPLVLLKAGAALLLRGMTAGFMSLCGGLLSLAVLLLLSLPRRHKASYLLLGCMGALFHNTGQLLGSALLMGDNAVFWYFPALCVFGFATGALSGTALRLCAPYLDRVGRFP